MPPRIHTDTPLQPGAPFALGADASRHVQVLRLQPGDAVTLFDGSGGQWQAALVEIGRKTVQVRLLAHEPLERELRTPVTLALGMPANERMDALVEKATELGVAAIVPLVCERSVLRLAGDRAERKAAHWQAIAVAACEQCGRNRVPAVAAPRALRDWLAGLGAGSDESPRLVLSLGEGAQPLRQTWSPARAMALLSGPEGGLAPLELAAAAQAGFRPVTLGPRVLRADTAPLAALAVIGALET